MAGQFHVAFSELLVGAGIVAGGPYDCAEGQLAVALNRCMDTALGVPDPAQLHRKAETLAEDGRIDPLSGLRGDRVYSVRGYRGRDRGARGRRAGGRVLSPGRPAGSRDRVGRRRAGGARLRHRGRGQCLRRRPGARSSTTATTTRRARSSSTSTGPCSRRPRRRPARWSRSTRPSSCPRRPATAWPRPASSTCRRAAPRAPSAGCTSPSTAAGRRPSWSARPSSTGAGYNRWADSNRLILLYPQAHATALNPNACWDWWGYDDPDYMTRSGRQMAAVRAMLGAARRRQRAAGGVLRDPRGLQLRPLAGGSRQRLRLVVPVRGRLGREPRLLGQPHDPLREPRRQLQHHALRGLMRAPRPEPVTSLVRNGGSTLRIPSPGWRRRRGSRARRRARNLARPDSWRPRALPGRSPP